MRYTMNPIIWLRFFAWKIQFWWSYRDPFKLFFIREQADGTWRIPKIWGEKYYQLRLDWYYTVKNAGSWLIFSHLRRFAGYAHKCEFTDRKEGLLYCGQGAGMDDLFDSFVESLGK